MAWFMAIMSLAGCVGTAGGDTTIMSRAAVIMLGVVMSAAWLLDTGGWECGRCSSGEGESGPPSGPTDAGGWSWSVGVGELGDSGPLDTIWERLAPKSAAISDASTPGN